MNEGLQQIQDFLRGLSLQQKALLAGGAVAVGLILWLFVALLGSGKNVVLYSGLKSRQTRRRWGAVWRPRISPTKFLRMAEACWFPPKSSMPRAWKRRRRGCRATPAWALNCFDTPNWAGSDFSEKVNYQRALEGELERTLQTLGEVEAVRVHLVLPRESLFSEQERESKAAVIVKTRERHAFPRSAASHSATGRERGRRPAAGKCYGRRCRDGQSFLARRGPSGRASFDSDEELAAAAVHAIEPVVGAEHVRASVHVDYDLSSSEDTSEIYDPKATATLAQQHSEELAGGANPAGVPGVTSNVPGSAAAIQSAPPVPTSPAAPGGDSSGRGLRRLHSERAFGYRQPEFEIRQLDLRGQQEYPPRPEPGGTRAPHHGVGAGRRRDSREQAGKRQAASTSGASALPKR